MAQSGHRIEMNLKMRFFGYRKEHIRPLNDTKAIEMGANFLSEAIIFSVAGGVILFENQRSRNAARDRKTLVDESLARLETDNEALQGALTHHTALNTRLESEVADLRQDMTLIREVLDRHLSHEIENLHHDIAQRVPRSRSEPSPPVE
ncbi:hypothetical protein IWQ60_001067 [Tieghemiomyces parasiticus]|uniref:OPA3-like protein n=1 Tax=Tieghemiomyces parasiticus TaxID=78921 RepID=A0A9W8AEQ8_9FUNG|nr:hypothetical protein IWQ60_001067 [Tieghemiomyces parasiticus]